jgi:hypothetical protein
MVEVAVWMVATIAMDVESVLSFVEFLVWRVSVIH